MTKPKASASGTTTTSASSTTHLDRLRAIREGHRRIVTKLSQELTGIVEGQLETKDYERLDVMRQLLDGKQKALSEIDQEILALCTVEEIDQEMQQSEDVTASIIGLKGKIENVIKARTPTINQQHIESSQATALPINRTRLPKLSLPKFKGNVTKWNTFWDSFQSAVHCNEGIANIDKFNYLNSYLEGAAARAIQGLTLTESNYEEAVKILKERFGRPQQIITAHMDELLKVQSCSIDRPASLRYVYDQICVHTRGLASLGVTTDQYGSLLIPIIMSKLPSEIRLQIARNSKDSVWKIDELLSVIKIEVEAREASEATKTSEDNKTSQATGYSKSRGNQQPTAKSLLSQGQGENFKIKCAFCQNEHYSASCEVVKDISQRRNILQRDKRCFNCLRVGHHVKECKAPKTCRHCQQRHHQSICSLRYTEKVKPKEDTKPETTATTTIVNNKAKRTVLLQTAKATAVNDCNSKAKSVRILMDTGSQRSYITNRLKSKLNLPVVKSETLHLNTFGDERYTKQQCDVVNLRLQGSQGEIGISALCFPKICSAVSAKINVDNYTHLQGLELADSSIIEGDQQDIDVLIGSDYYFDVVSGDVIRGDSGPVAVSSTFGWILSGHAGVEESRDMFSTTNLNITRSETVSVSPFDIHSENDELVNTLHKFWETESLGVRDETSLSHSDNDEFLKEIRFNEKEGKYEVCLPWKEGQLPASNEYGMCVRRLRQLHSRLKKNQELLRDYDNVIKEQVNSGIIEAVPEDDNSQDPTHFLPHHGVIRQDRETTKLRVVFDGSAKTDKSTASINECLEKGPNLVPRLFDIVVKFRSYPVAVVADIEKAFHQIQIDPGDRRMLRFLWFDDIDKEFPEIKQYQFRRLVFGLTPSPAILASTIQHHLVKYEEKEPDVTSLLSSSLYVDDLAGGVFHEEETMELYDSAQRIMKEGGFLLRKWNSNSQPFRERIKKQEEMKSQEATNTSTSEKEITSPVMEHSTQEEQFVKVLGIYWDVVKDEFRYDLSDLIKYAESLPLTKRSVLKLSAKVFDPMGLVTPVTISMKILFQSLCIEKVNWDEKLEGEALAKWNAFICDLNALKNIRVSRCYADHQTAKSTPCTYQLHGFSDASGRAYAAAVYMRTEFSNGEVQVNLMTSKTRVSPIKQQSIPRLELLGATLLSQLVHATQEAIQPILKIDETFLWTDSFTVLCWIKNPKLWKPYVQHRVNKIRELTEEDRWNFCPGELNPADIPSRGCRGERLVNSQTWWSGPKFLMTTKELWPNSPQTSVMMDNEEVLQEIVKHPGSVTHSLVTTESEEKQVNVSKVMDIQRYSNITRLLRITAYVLRFINNIKQHILHRNNHDKTGKESLGKELEAQELNQAETLWIKDVQEASFAKELGFLRSNLVTNPPIYVIQLGLFLDEQGMIRCKGRLNNAPLSQSSKTPVLLPNKHELSNLIIQDVHSKIKHSGIKDTLTTIRERFWILRGREAVKQILRKCVTCRKVEGVPYRPPTTSDLPIERVSLDPPFTHTGLDFAGPLYIRDGNTATEKGDNKVYICLFTCASTRAIHLELTPALSVQAFLLAFRRFASRRGLPSTLMSDNAKTFKAASKEIKKIIHSEEIHRYLTDNRITWNFIVEKAPWWGGFWERMVKCVKQSLKKTVGRTTLSYDELQTTVVEMEAIVNARPLTYVYDDEESVSNPLTPSHLINGRRVTIASNSQHVEILSVNQTLTKRAKHHQRLLQQFASRWQREYLLSLRERAHERCKGQNRESPISVGDIVIVKSDLTKRNFWKLAKVEELLYGRDGHIRSAKVKVARKDDRNPQVLRRTIQHLIPIEINSS